jgi:hypothetical protein
LLHFVTLTFATPCRVHLVVTACNRGTGHRTPFEFARIMDNIVQRRAETMGMPLPKVRPIDTEYLLRTTHNDIDVSCHSQFSIGSFVVRGRYFKAEERRYDAMLLKFEADGKPLLVAVAGDDNMWRGYEEEVEVSSPEL